MREHPRTAEQTAFVLWFTGLSGAGKSTLADIVAARLETGGHKVERLDGDLVRSLFPATGFDAASRDNHIRQMGFVASILERNGVVAVCSFVSPYKNSRDFCRSLCSRFVEVFVATPLSECERRDVKQLYKQARAGELPQFTGVSDPYEPPPAPEIAIDTRGRSVDDCAGEILDWLTANQYKAPEITKREHGLLVAS